MTAELKKATPTNPAPTAAVKAMRRKANEHLMAYFDVETGIFDKGWSDERISKESGMPVAWVIKRREEEYGPLKEPNEFEEIRHEAKALASEIGKLQSKIDAMSKRNGWVN